MSEYTSDSTDPERVAQSSVYTQHAREALAEAEATNLPNVRHRFITAAKRWIMLAEHARRVEQRHAEVEDRNGKSVL